MPTLTDLIRQWHDNRRADTQRTMLRLFGLQPKAEQALRDAGATIMHSGFELWCMSDNCNHVSHDAGQGWQWVEMPLEWQHEATTAFADIWDYPSNDDNPIALIPAEEPLLLVCQEASNGYAARTYICKLR